MLRTNSDELYLARAGVRIVLIAVEGGLIRLNSNEVVMLSLLRLRFSIFCSVVRVRGTN